MNIKFNRKLKELRQRNNITQEQLAGHLKISSQAVSKWERGEGYPEISLLPRIAIYFGVSIDELLGTDEEYVKIKIEEWTEESDRLLKGGDIERNFELWQEAYNEYPRVPKVMFQYMYALLRRSSDPYDCEEIERGIDIGREILECCTDNTIRNYTIRTMAYTYKQIGNLEQAKRYAEMTSDLVTCREVLLSDVLVGEEKQRHMQELMIQLTDEIAMKAIVLADGFYELDERIRICRYILKLYDMLFTDGDYGFYSLYISRYSFCLAGYYAEKRDRDRCLRYLRDSVRYAISFDKGVGEGERRTSLLLNRTVGESHSLHDHEFHECRELRKSLERELFAFISADAEFIKIKDELDAYLAEHDSE